MAPASTGSASSSRNTVTRMRPDEQRHLVQRHAGRAHVEDGGDEVDGAEDRRGAGEMDRQNDEIDRRAGMAGGRERRIDRPAGAGAERARLAFDEHRGQQQRERGRQQPERDVVHARERHVGRADHQRHEPVAEAADHRRHHHEEDHDQAVRGGEHVVFVRRREKLQAGILQLQADGDRQTGRRSRRPSARTQVHRADVLVVGRIDEPPPSGRMSVASSWASCAPCAAAVASHCSCPSTCILVVARIIFALSYVSLRRGRPRRAAFALGASVVVVANFFFAVSSQAEYSCSLTTCTAIGMKA